VPATTSCRKVPATTSCSKVPAASSCRNDVKSPSSVANVSISPALHIINALGRSATSTWTQVSQYIAHKLENPSTSAILTIGRDDYSRLQVPLSTFVDVTNVNGNLKSQLPYVVLRDPPFTKPPSGTLLTMTHNLDLKFIVKVNVGGTKTLAVLDSASSLSHIDSSLLKDPKVKLKPKADVGAIIAATGSAMTVKGTVNTCWKITYTGFSIPSETFNVIDIPYKGIGMIIGQDFLSKYQVDILNSTDSISLKYRGHKYSLPTDKLVPPSVAEKSYKSEHSAPYTTSKQISKDLKKGGRIILVMPTVDPPGSSTTRSATPVMSTLISDENIVLTTSENDCDLTDQEFKEYTAKFPDQIRKVLQKHRSVFKKKLPPGLQSKYQKLREANKEVIPTTTSEAVYAKRRRLSPKESDELKAQMEDHLRRKIVRESQSPYNAPLVFVQKPDGSIRMCVDYTLLNRVTVKHRGPLPNIQDLIDMLSGKAYFSSIDLVNGYRQILLSDSDIPKTAFSTPWGHYEALVVWEGLCNAPAVFQAVMNEVFKPYLGRFVLIYLDDILVFSKTLDEHAEHIDAVLTKLTENNLFAKLTKSDFCKEQLKWLGHIITREGVKMDPSKVQKILDWPTPKSSKELQSFIGLCGFFHTFIPNYATIIAPLDHLRNHTEPWTEHHPWGKAEDEAFKTLKKVIAHDITLKFPDPTGTYEVYCDASLYGVGAILVQDGKPVAFYSKKFTKEQINYSTYEQEFTAVVHALRVWRCYLEGVKFTLYTDHQPLTYYNSQPQLSRRQARWLNTIASFDFEWKHIKGEKNPADPLSRYPGIDKDEVLNAAIQHKAQVLCTLAVTTKSGKQYVNPKLENWIAEHRPDLLGQTTLEKAKTAKPPPTVSAVNGDEPHAEPQYEDDTTGEEKLNPVITKLLQGYANDPWFKQQSNLKGLHQGENGVWYRKTKLPQIVQIVIPNNDDLKKEILRECHDTLYSGHPGVQSTYQNIFRRYWWPGLFKDTEQYVLHCPVCQMHKPLPYTHGKMTPLAIPKSRWESISMDLITDLPRTLAGSDSILTVVDRFSKMAHFIPTTKTCTAEKVADLLIKHVISKHGLPKSIVSDRDTRFATSNFSKQLWNLTGTQLCTSTSYHPQTDGQTERYNRMIEQTLRMYVQPHGRDWEKLLPMCEFAINNNHHSSIGTTPFYLNYGFHPRTPLSLSFPSPESGKEATPAETFWKDLQDLQKSATKCLESAQQRMKLYADKHRKEVSYAPGQSVLLKTTNLHLKGSKKFLPRFIGPFKILQKCGPVAYKLELPASWRVHNVFHVSNLRLFKQLPGTTMPDVPENLSDAYLVHSITGHDYLKIGKRVYLRLKVHYQGKGIPDSMEFAADLLPEYEEKVTQYKKSHGLPV
jgi:hypothetical protein